MACGELVMKAIRYKLHFATLTVAGVVFLLAKNLFPPYWISNFDFFHYGLMGALHATCVAVSLRDRKAARPFIVLFHYACYPLERCDPYFGIVGFHHLDTLIGFLASKPVGRTVNISHRFGNRRIGILAVSAPILVEVTSAGRLA